MTARRKIWGWGLEGQTVTDAETQLIAQVFSQRFGAALVPEAGPRPEDFALRPSRLSPPSQIADFCFSTDYERLVHAYGKSFPDYVRLLNRDVPSPPDIVAYPSSEADVSAASPKSVRCRHSAAPADTTSTVIPSISRGILILAIRSRTSSTRCFAELLG